MLDIMSEKWMRMVRDWEILMPYVLDVAVEAQKLIKNSKLKIEIGI